MNGEEHGPLWLRRLHDWRVEHVSDKMFLLVLAFMVGLLSAVAAYVLHGLINTIVDLLTGSFMLIHTTGSILSIPSLVST